MDPLERSRVFRPVSINPIRGAFTAAKRYVVIGSLFDKPVPSAVSRESSCPKQTIQAPVGIH